MEVEPFVCGVWLGEESVVLEWVFGVARKAIRHDAVSVTKRVDELAKALVGVSFGALCDTSSACLVLGRG